MTRNEAKKQAEKRWGKRALWRVGERQSSPERRQLALDEAAAIRQERATLEAEIGRLEEAAGIPALRERIKTLSAATRERLLGEGSYYKFEVGFRDSIIGAFNIVGSGDTWEEAFAQADARNRKAV